MPIIAATRTIIGNTKLPNQAPKATLLTRTLFNPFRQISAASSHDLSLPAQLNAFFDRLFSRAVGTVVRTIMIIVGLLMLLLRFLWVGGLIIAWLVLPILPIVGLILNYQDRKSVV